MQILKDSSAITQTIPRIVETPDYLIINGQVYDKVTFKPIPLEFNIVNTPLLYSSFNQCIWTHDNASFVPILFLHYGNNKNQKMYQDSEDPNIFYILFKYPDYGIKLIKFKKWFIEQFLVDFIFKLCIYYFFYFYFIKLAF